ncbi:MAG: hypothetical protein J6X62_06090 [Bacteroidales bacterium]|nr:hypothetical protein [Bacteroidales bacterium]
MWVFVSALQAAVGCQKRGHPKKHHFAHYSGEDCTGARMTALHMLAQQIIAEEKKLVLPGFHDDYYSKKAKSIAFDQVLLEVPYKNMRTDCVGIKYSQGKEHPLWIEICVTHEVDEQKRQQIRDLNIPCVEIYMSDMLDTDYSKESVRERLISEGWREWICCPKYEHEVSKRIEMEKEMLDKVKQWYKDGDPGKAECFVKEIKNRPYIDSGAEYGMPCMPIRLYEELVPKDDYMYYIDKSPKDEAGLKLFYTLLSRYYLQIEGIGKYDINHKLQFYQYKRNILSLEEKLHLEQLISLRVIRYVIRTEVCQELIKQYTTNVNVRKEVLMASSVIYHHVVGSDVQTFGELTREIIMHHPHLVKSYLQIIKSQSKYRNNYYIGNQDMLIVLDEFVKKNDVRPNKYVDNILKACYAFAFPCSKDMYNTSDRVVDTAYSNKSKYKQPSDHKAEWDELKEWYRNN